MQILRTRSHGNLIKKINKKNKNTSNAEAVMIDKEDRRERLEREEKTPLGGCVEKESGRWKNERRWREVSRRWHMMNFAHSLACFSLSSPQRADLFIRQTSGQAEEK